MDDQSGMPEPRLDTFIWANITLASETGEGSIQNVGPGGLFVRSSTIGDTGDEVRLSFEGSHGEIVEVVGVILWTKHNLGGRGPGLHGFGVRLTASSGNYRSLLETLSHPRWRSTRQALAV
jgi:hypothetical protein